MKTNMEKEIFSQTDVLKRIWEKYVKDGKIEFNFEFDFEEIKFIASGSSYNASRLGHKFFETYTHKRVSFEYSSEFISNWDKKIKKDTLYCFVSQSGETYDTKCALDIVKKEGGKTLAVVNNSNSYIYNNSDFKIDVLAGVENSIAATKSFLACVVCLWLLSVSYSSEYNIAKLPFVMDEAIIATENSLKISNGIKDAAKTISKKEKISLIGYNFGYILAKEGALKIKETSYTDTTAYPTGEFLHGHTAILNKNKTLVEIYTDTLSEFEENTLLKIKQDFNPEIIAITDKKSDTKNAIKFNKYNYNLSKICAITVILQRLALEVALILGADVDKPTGLHKVVGG